MGLLKQEHVWVALGNATAEVVKKLRAAGYDHAFDRNGEQLNEFCREPPCASPICRRDRKCNFA